MALRRYADAEQELPADAPQRLAKLKGMEADIIAEGLANLPLGETVSSPSGHKETSLAPTLVLTTNPAQA